MKAFKDYENTQSYTEGMRLPVGGYVCKIMNVRYEEGTNGNSDMVVLQFDIEEGEQKGFYRKQYDANTAEDKKWKGVHRIYVPTDDGSEQDGWTKRAFKTFMENLEASNAGYKWNWDETTLKGKVFGAVFGEIYTVIDGKEIMYVGVRKSATVDAIRKGDYKIPDKQLKNGAKGVVTPRDDSSSDTMSNILHQIDSAEEEEIPFA